MSTESKFMRGVVASLLSLAMLVAGGCATLQSFFGESPQQNASQKTPPLSGNPKAQLEKARNLVINGEDDLAKKLLTSVAAGARRPGITDEALFHLGLITMKEESEAGGFQQSRQILDRLIREYPQSVWGVEAEALNDLLVGLWQSEVSLGKIKRQIKALKDSNLSLSKENKELRLNIEKLKNLDLELEHKSRR